MVRCWPRGWEGSRLGGYGVQASLPLSSYPTNIPLGLPWTPGGCVGGAQPSRDPLQVIAGTIALQRRGRQYECEAGSFGEDRTVGMEFERSGPKAQQWLDKLDNDPPRSA
jgi:hypothetical protein